MNIEKTNIYSVIMFCFISCNFLDGYEGGGGGVKITNRTNFPVAVEFSEDTITPKIVSKVEAYLDEQIRFQDTMEFSGLGGRAEWLNMIAISINQKLNVFIYDVDTLTKYMDMEYIVKNRLWIKRMSFTEAQLDSMKWVITYE